MIKLVCKILLSTIPFFSFGQPFVEVSQSLGINHYAIDGNGMCAGVVLFDLNNDDYVDIFATGGEASSHLYLNDQAGGFIDLSESSGISNLDAVTCGATSGDFNNDGHIDLFITTDQGYHNILLLNKGDQTFEDISMQSGIANGEKIWSTSSTFVDVNADGFLDLYVGNYVSYNSKPHMGSINHPLRNHLFINNQDGTFSEKSMEYGMHTERATLAVTAIDLDGDLMPDFFEGNDFGTRFGSNEMYLNRINTSKESLIARGVFVGLDDEADCMGISNGDYNNDQKIDLFYTDFYNSNLKLNSSEECLDFSSIEKYSNHNDREITWGNAMVDYNNDTHLDLVVSCGPLLDNVIAAPLWIFEKIPNATFQRMDHQYGIEASGIGRGLAMADYDNDGDMDIFWAHVNESEAENNLHIYRNDLPSSNNWVKFSLHGIASNPQGFHSFLKVHSGDMVWLKHQDAGNSYLSQNASYVHMGMGELTQIDSIQVIWPSGNVQTEYNIKLNNLNTITERVGADKYIGQNIACLEDEQAPLSTSIDKTAQIIIRKGPDAYLIETNEPINYIQISDLSGKLLAQEQHVNSNTFRFEQFTSESPQLFILKISTIAGIVSKKIYIPAY